MFSLHDYDGNAINRTAVLYQHGMSVYITYCYVISEKFLRNLIEKGIPRLYYGKLCCPQQTGLGENLHLSLRCNHKNVKNSVIYRPERKEGNINICN